MQAPSVFIAVANKAGSYLLAGRDIIANDIEWQVEAALLDGMICLTSCDKPPPGHLMAAARLDLDGRGDVATLVETDRDTGAATRSNASGPAESLRSRFQNGPRARIFDVPQPEGEWIHLRQRGQAADKHLTREVVGRGRQSAIRPGR